MSLCRLECVSVVCVPYVCVVGLECICGEEAGVKVRVGGSSLLLGYLVVFGYS